MRNLDLANLLAMGGQAISPEGSWQQNLGAAAGDMASQEQARQYLGSLLSGNQIPDPSGRWGLDPNVVLQGVQLQHQIQPQPAEPVVPVELKSGETVNVPQSELHEFQRKREAEFHTPATSPIRTFQSFQHMDPNTQQAFLEFSKTQRGKSFEEALAEFEARRRLADRVDKDLEYGTVNHWDRVAVERDSRTVTEELAQRREEEPNLTSRQVAVEQTIRRMRQDLLEFHGDKYQDIVYRNVPAKGGRGFYGKTADGKWELIRQFTPRRK